jgi:hypothetical protein
MVRALRDGSGFLLLIGALAVLWVAITSLRLHDFLSAIVLVVVGLALLGASVELLRPSVGE